MQRSVFDRRSISRGALTKLAPTSAKPNVVGAAIRQRGLPAGKLPFIVLRSIKLYTNNCEEPIKKMLLLPRAKCRRGMRKLSPTNVVR